MEKQVRVYAVDKNGKWDILNSRDAKSGHFPKTVTAVFISWGDGTDSTKIDIVEFLNNYELKGS